MQLSRPFALFVLTGSIVLSTLVAGPASSAPLGNLLDFGSSGGPITAPPSDPPYTDRAFSVRFNLPDNDSGANRTYRVRAVPTDSTCAIHISTLNLTKDVAAGQSGGSIEDILAFMRDANPFTACAYIPSVVLWDLTLTTPRGSQVYKTQLWTQSGDNYLLWRPYDDTDVAESIKRIPSGIVFDVK